MGKTKIMEADEQRGKILSLNRIQTWLIVFGTAIGIITAVTAWANGWLGLPEKVDRIERAQVPLMGITNRVELIEQQQRLLWERLSADHDLLIGINQSLADMKQQQAEMRQDVKDLKK